MNVSASVGCPVDAPIVKHHDATVGGCAQVHLNDVRPMIRGVTKCRQSVLCMDGIHAASVGGDQGASHFRTGGDSSDH